MNLRRKVPSPLNPQLQEASRTLIQYEDREYLGVLRVLLLTETYDHKKEGRSA